MSYVDHYTILGLLPDPQGGVCDITDLYFAKFHLLPIGFDPYVGFYHQPRFGRPALALDLMEEFRLLVRAAPLKPQNS